MFFIILGGFFLYCGLMLLDETHSAFIFILTILGISLIFFGTGSHAVASASGDNQVTGKFSAGIAGGAAALAAIFGFGTVALEEKIQNFFQRTVSYGFLKLTPSEGVALSLDFDKNTILANLPDGRPLPILKQSKMIEIAVPRYSMHEVSTVSVTIDGPSVALVPPDEKTKQYEIDWDKVPAETTYANEKLRIAHLIFNLPLPPPNNPDQKNQPQQTIGGQPIQPYPYVPQ